MINPRYLDPLINVAAAIVILAIGGYIAWEALQTEATEPCRARYPGATRFSLQSSEGKPLSAIELQARAGVRDLGVIDNATVVPVTGGPLPEALEVKLRKLPEGADPSAQARNGIEFRWAPPGMAKATAACLSYSVWLPEKFAFGDGGFLPGVSGGAATAAGSNEGGIAISPRWDHEGRILLSASTAGGIRRMADPRGKPLPTDRWVRLDQEIVLNDPGQENGIGRLWVDGALAVDDTRVPLRKDADTLLTGVLAAIGYSHVPAQAGMLRVSPFEISWR